jgi:hypothetical protein
MMDRALSEFLHGRRSQAAGFWRVLWDAVADVDQGRIGEALEKLDQLSRVEDADIVHAAAIQRAEIQAGSGRFEDALSTIRGAIRTNYSTYAAVLEASLLRKLGRQTEAHTTYEGIVEKLTSDDQAVAQIIAHDYGQLLRTLGMSDDLVALRQRLVTLYPDRLELNAIFEKL